MGLWTEGAPAPSGRCWGPNCPSCSSCVRPSACPPPPVVLPASSARPSSVRLSATLSSSGEHLQGRPSHLAPLECTSHLHPARGHWSQASPAVPLDQKPQKGRGAPNPWAMSWGLRGAGHALCSAG